MIRHIVMWRVRGDSVAQKAANLALLKRRFESLRGRIPGMTALEIGVDHSRVDYACDVVLLSSFESQAALDAYAVHPEHLRVKQELGEMRIARHQVDYAVAEREPAQRVEHA
ncbi:Dabb family protein [Variovorax sp. GB1P17]|uniref:Dabb family protein n=1 Tax=Variovorax sp. GB1P17 TaxID=3443740 RepID=UPI003F4767D7